MTPEAQAHIDAAKRIARYAVDSSNLQTIGYEAELLVVQFKHGSIYLYPGVPADVFEAFSRAESRGRFYAQHIKGQYPAVRATGICATCGSQGQWIGPTCEACQGGPVREVETKYPQADDAAKVSAELQGMRKVMGLEDAK